MNEPIPDVREMLTHLIAAPSVSSVSPRWDQSNQGVIELLAAWLEALDFSVEVMPLPGAAGKYNLIATLGQGPGGLVLSGHTDTVPFDEARWQSDPLRLEERDNRWYGLGSCDMKGFFPLALSAARQFRGQTLKQPLIILATADEESSMEGARVLVRAGRPKGRAAVIGEPTELRPIRMHKGIMMEKLCLTGQSGHSSDPALGRNALEGMHAAIAEILAVRRQWQQQYRHGGFRVDYPTLNLGHIHGGDNPNRICGQCELHFDLRPLPGMQIDEIRQVLRERLTAVARERDLEIDYRPLFQGVPPFETGAEAELVRLCERLTGHPAESVAFATEAPFLQQLGMEVLVMGPGSIDQAHQPNEFLALTELDPAVRLLTSLIDHYCLQSH